MTDREKVIKGLREMSCRATWKDIDGVRHKFQPIINDVIALLKEQQSLLGIRQAADGITFISTGTAKQGEERGILLGKLLMNEWIYKELLYKGLLTDDIRSVLEQAKHI